MSHRPEDPAGIPLVPPACEDELDARLARLLRPVEPAPDFDERLARRLAVERDSIRRAAAVRDRERERLGHELEASRRRLRREAWFGTASWLAGAGAIVATGFQLLPVLAPLAAATPEAALTGGVSVLLTWSGWLVAGAGVAAGSWSAFRPRA